MHGEELFGGASGGGRLGGTGLRLPQPWDGPDQGSELLSEDEELSLLRRHHGSDG